VRRHLRRQDVAALAGISTSYYTHLEQGRRSHPSPDVVARLAVALDLGPAARSRLEELAELAEEDVLDATHGMRGIENALNAFDHVPAMVADASLAIRSSNRLWRGLHADFSFTGDLASMVFLDGLAERFFSDWRSVAVRVVRHLRRHADSPGVRTRAQELSTASREFESLWNSPTLEEVRAVTAVMHPALGELHLRPEAFAIPSAPAHHLHVLLPEPESTTTPSLLLLDLFDRDPDHGTRSR
jgi:transcriptional regulator with XRE-family HTH domain